MKRKLLIIDDDEQVHLLVSRFLKRKNWDYSGASTGAEGLAKSSSLRPDIVLLDIELPDVEGWEVCSRLKSDPALNATPVFMVSGHRLSPDDKVAGIKAGADDFLSKPFNLTELLLRMEAVLKVRGK